MRHTYIITLLIGLLFAAPSLPAHATQAKYSQLQTLIAKDITNDETLPLDSVYKWGTELCPGLLKEKRYKEYFEIELLLVNVQATQGDITLAVDRVQRMMNKAVELNEPYGIALAGIGIGNTYTYSSMVSEAIPSYKEALKQFTEQGNKRYRRITLIKIVHSLLIENQPEEAAAYMQEMNSLFTENQGCPLTIYSLLYNALYYTMTEQFDAAKAALDKATVHINKEPKSLRTASLHVITARYYAKKKQYEAALNELTYLTPEMELGLDPGRFIDLVSFKAKLYQKLGQTREASLTYKRIINLKDSLAGQSYSRQVNTLRAVYEVNQIDLDNQVERSKQIGQFILIALILLAAIILFGLYTIRSNKLLEKSRQQLAKAKVQAENSIRSKSMILSNMSHEIRTPLNALTGFSAILTEDSIDAETRQQCNEIIQQNSELLMKLINDVIDLSSLEFGKMQFNFKEYDAVKICRNVAETVEKVKQTAAAVVFETNLDTLPLDTDEARLQQVLINLMINATKFTQTGTITLQLTLETEDSALFTVTDTGCGIPPEKQKRIFERFEKLDELAQGTGLGLSICQLIINHIGGNIWIDPEYTTGSRFCFTHPLHRSKKDE